MKSADELLAKLPPIQGDPQLEYDDSHSTTTTTLPGRSPYIVIACPHPSHTANVSINKHETDGVVTWSLEVSAKCSLCGSQLLLAGQQAHRINATHER